MKSLLNNKGFTLIELVMVIVILGILAAVAVPKFSNIQDEAKVAAEAGVVGGVRAGIMTYQMGVLAGAISDTAAYNNYEGRPATLDTISGDADASATNPYFTKVLDQGGITSDWTKGSGDYIGPSQSNTSTYTYTNTDGSFIDTDPGS